MLSIVCLFFSYGMGDEKNNPAPCYGYGDVLGTPADEIVDDYTLIK